MVGSPTLARTLRTDLVASISAGALPAAGPKRVVDAIDAFIAAISAGWSNRKGTPYTEQSARSLIQTLRHDIVGHSLAERNLADVKRSDIQRLIDELHVQGLSGSTIRKIVHAVKSLYSWARYYDYVDTAPTADVRFPARKAKPRDRVASVTEMRDLLDALILESGPEVTDPFRDVLPFALAVYTTARRAEIRYLRVGDVDLDAGVIRLAVDPRARKSDAARRDVPIVRPLRIILQRSLMARGRPGQDELMCPGPKPGGSNSGMMSVEALHVRAQLAWGWQRSRDANGRVGPWVPDAERRTLAPIRLHECRHTCISWLAAAKVRDVVVSHWAGHHLSAREHERMRSLAAIVSRLSGEAERTAATPEAYTGLFERDAPSITKRVYSHVLPDELDEARDQFDAYLAATVADNQPSAVTRGEP